MQNFTKRLIPCLDIKDKRVVKGTKFLDLKDAGEPVEIAKYYNDNGADELVFLDIRASIENRGAILDIIKQSSKEIFIPLTVGGGVNSLDDIYALLDAGSDKVSINSGALKNPNLIYEATKRFGSQCIVGAVDFKQTQDSYEVYSHGGSLETKINAFEWIKRLIDLGVGELLLTSMDRDGTKEGFDLDFLRSLSFVKVPIIASGGAGSKEDIKESFLNGADAVLAASIFHYKEIEIKELKKYLKENNINVRL